MQELVTFFTVKNRAFGFPLSFWVTKHLRSCLRLPSSEKGTQSFKRMRARPGLIVLRLLQNNLARSAERPVQ